ncbi:hypothetical protein HDV05_007212 [Chytridiales sp. JEL 0842]|nr:hypothetical protein HDV05_007212 [Chytridiales sp. JEL 0842]
MSSPIATLDIADPIDELTEESRKAGLFTEASWTNCTEEDSESLNDRLEQVLTLRGLAADQREAIRLLPKGSNPMSLLQSVNSFVVEMHPALTKMVSTTFSHLKNPRKSKELVKAIEAKSSPAPVELRCEILKLLSSMTMSHVGWLLVMQTMQSGSQQDPKTLNDLLSKLMETEEEHEKTTKRCIASQ